MSRELSDKIIERLDAEKIAPLPRLRFLLLRGLFWLFAILSVVIGGLAIGTIFFLLTDLYASGFLGIPHDVVELLLMVPYLWLVVFILFVLVARISLKYTKKGYKYRLSYILSISIASSIILGSIFFLAGIGRVTHEFLNNFPLYDSAVQDTKEALELHEMRLPHSQ